MASLPVPLDAFPLDERRVLIVQCQSPQALSLGATVARAGGRVTVARTRSAALAEITREGKGFDAAVVDAQLPGDGVASVVHALRSSPWPCLAVGFCPSGSQADRRRAVVGGVVDLFVPPHSPDAFVAVIARCAEVTAHLRSRLEGGMLPVLESIPTLRRPPHDVEEGPRCLVAPTRVRRSDLESRVRSFADGRGLSDRELAVLRFIAMGYRYDEIGEAMAISARTVKMHATNVRKKVGASDRNSLVRKMYAAR